MGAADRSHRPGRWGTGRRSVHPYHVGVTSGRPGSNGSLLVVGAHAADFVWRAAGTIALHTAAGWRAAGGALSYGERGEAGGPWEQPGGTGEEGKRIRPQGRHPAPAGIRRPPVAL